MLLRSAAVVRGTVSAGILTAGLFLAVLLATLTSTGNGAIAVPAVTRPALAPVADADVGMTLGVEERKNRCYVGNLLHAGGPLLKEAVQTALAGSDEDLAAVVVGAPYRMGTLGDAYWADADEIGAQWDKRNARFTAWEDSLEPYGVYESVPEFDEDVQAFWRGYPDRVNAAWAQGGRVPQPSAEARDAARAIVTAQRSDLTTALLGPLVADVGSADDVRLFLQAGGFPRSAPVAGSAQERVEIEAL